MSLSGRHNRPSGASPEELHERAVAALVRVWGVTGAEARAAIDRVRRDEKRRGPELARAWREAEAIEAAQQQPRVIDLTDRALTGDWRVYDDHGTLVYGRVEDVLPAWSA